MSDDRIVVLFRHGIAEEKSAGIPDEERRLTDAGNEKMARIAPAFARLRPDLEAIYSSPLVRARETAEWLAKAYDGLAVQTTAALQPSAGPAEFRKLLDEVDAQCAVFVGHEPNLSAIMLDLTSMHADGDLSLKKGGCYGVRVGEQSGRLKWMLTPHILDPMA
jgi:phosphohistidine phosphatase